MKEPILDDLSEVVIEQPVVEEPVKESKPHADGGRVKVLRDTYIFMAPHSQSGRVAFAHTGDKFKPLAEERGFIKIGDNQWIAKIYTEKI